MVLGGDSDSSPVGSPRAGSIPTPRIVNSLIHFICEESILFKLIIINDSQYLGIDPRLVKYRTNLQIS